MLNTIGAGEKWVACPRLLELLMQSRICQGETR